MAALSGCEPMRPEVTDPSGAEAPTESLDRLWNDRLSLADVVWESKRLLRVEGDGLTLAKRRLIEARLLWFLFAHIVDEACVDLTGRERALGSLVVDIRAESSGSSRPRSGGTSGLPRDLELLAPLLMEDAPRASLDDARRALDSSLAPMAADPEPEIRALVQAARDWLGREVAWRFSREWVIPALQLRRWVEVLDRKTTGQAESRALAWLGLRVGFALALERPRVPEGTLLTAVAIILGRDDVNTAAAAPTTWLLQLGRGQGETPPERLHDSWKKVREAVSARIDDRLGLSPAAVSASWAGRLWTSLSKYLRIADGGGGGGGVRPTPGELHLLAEAQRGDAVRQWTDSLQLPPVTTPAALERLESTIRPRAAELTGRDAQRFEATWAMVTLAVEEVIAARLPEGSRPPGIGGTGAYDTWTLSLGSRGSISSFPGRVKTCLLAPAAERRVGCLEDVVSEAVKLGERPEPSRPGTRPRPIVKPSR